MFTLMLNPAFLSQACCLYALQQRANIHNLNVAVFSSTDYYSSTDWMIFKLYVLSFELKIYNILVFQLDPFSAYNFLDENRVKFHALP